MRHAIFALAAGVALIGGSSAWAQSLDFTVPAVNTGASISYATSGGDLVGTSISITDVTGIGTPSNAGAPVGITNGFLNFSSGAFASVNGSEWDFGGGGPITITATSPFGGGALLSGTITNAQVTGSGGTYHVAIAAFFNTISSGVASYFGVPTSGWSGNLSISFNTSNAVTAPGTFTSSSVRSGDVTTSVPEPSTMAIAGLGALGLIGYGLRRRRA
ncbi:MAG: PEP-CTERM sorting domain-containing protein [Isosphaeraceae bacterium]